MTVGYRVVERFHSAQGDLWTRYTEWSGLGHLREVVGLDSSLCPPLLPHMSGADWAHSVFADCLDACFDDPSFALSRAAGVFDASLHQVLAVAVEPEEPDLRAALPPGFRFKGFELADSTSGTSALTNCGGFPLAFGPGDLTDAGLVPAIGRAYEIRKSLAAFYPDEPHADCVVWAVWRQEHP